MIDQPALFDAPAAAPTLTDRQQTALDAIERTPDGLTADEIGAWSHTIPGPRSTFTHGHDDRCEFCGKAGRSIGDKLVDLGLLKRKRGQPGQGLVYVSVDAAGPGAAKDGPDDEIPF